MNALTTIASGQIDVIGQGNALHQPIRPGHVVTMNSIIVPLVPFPAFSSVRKHIRRGIPSTDLRVARRR